MTFCRISPNSSRGELRTNEPSSRHVDGKLGRQGDTQVFSS